MKIESVVLSTNILRIISYLKLNNIKTDIISDLYIFLYDMKISKYNDLVKQGRIYHFITGWMFNRYISDKGPIKRIENKYTSICDNIEIEIDDNIEHKILLEQKLEKIEQILNEVDFFDAFLFREYYYERFDDKLGKLYKPYSLRTLSQEYHLDARLKLSYSFIRKKIKKVQKFVIRRIAGEEIKYYK
jgi:hypothetical protein